MTDATAPAYPSPSQDEILRCINTLFAPDDVIEIRAIKGKFVDFGYFDADHRPDLVRAVVKSNRGRANLYCPINPVMPDLLARSANRMKRAGGRDATASDTVIRRRVWLPIDIDPERPSGISATDAEKAAARDMARLVVSWLRAQGWPDPVIGDSGNGLHVLYRIDLPADDAARDLIKAVLVALSGRFDTPAAKVDQSVFNASRIWKIYGTVACKGDHLPERPHRAAALIHVPPVVEVVTEDMLRSVAGGTIKPPAPPITNVVRANSSWHGASFAEVNQAAMARLDAWVPALLPMARPYHDGYRVAAADLDRGLEEDLSLVPEGIRDFGQEDGLTPIDTVMRFGGPTRPQDAASWLAGRLGLEWRSVGRSEPANYPLAAEPVTHAQELLDDEQVPLDAYMDEIRGGRKIIQAKTGMPISQFSIRMASELDLHLDQSYYIKGIWYRGSISMTWGPSGHGKTFVTADMCLHIASGRPWCGYRVRRAGVIYMAAENPDSVERRIVTMCDKSGIPRETLPLCVVSGAFNVVRDPLLVLEATAAAAAKLKSDYEVDECLLVIDTMSRAAPGMAENSPEDMSAFIGTCDRVRFDLGVGTVLVHHAGKDVDRGARGHNAHKGAVDCELLVTDGEIRFEKLRDGKTGQCIPFSLDVHEVGTDSDGDIVTTCTVSYEEIREQKESRNSLTPTTFLAFEALKEATSSNTKRSTGTSVIPAGKSCCDIEAWRTRFYSRIADREPEARKKAFQRAKDDLMAKKLIGGWEQLVWIW